MKLTGERVTLWVLMTMARAEREHGGPLTMTSSDICRRLDFGLSRAKYGLPNEHRQDA
jgi:hypothetical protein